MKTAKKFYRSLEFVIFCISKKRFIFELHPSPGKNLSLGFHRIDLTQTGLNGLGIMLERDCTIYAVKTNDCTNTSIEFDISQP